MRQNILSKDMLGDASNGGGISPPIQLNKEELMYSSWVYKEG
jgi:hypothetical protein